jgi:hypothetical protein
VDVLKIVLDADFRNDIFRSVFSGLEMLIMDGQGDFSAYLPFLGPQKFPKRQKEVKTSPIQKQNGVYNFDHGYGLRRKAFFFGAGIFSRNLSAESSILLGSNCYLRRKSTPCARACGSS